MIETGHVLDEWGDKLTVEVEQAEHEVRLVTVDEVGQPLVIPLTPEAAEELADYLKDAATAAREARAKEEC